MSANAEVNIFSPFNSRPEGHEDRLSWAFLIALKYEPSLQELFRSIVVSRIPREWLPSSPVWDSAVVQTQTSNVGTRGTHIVSVLISDASLRRAVGVAPLDRVARYDGVVEYADGLTVVIENKPDHRNARDEQFSPSARTLDSETQVVFGELVTLTWADLLERMLVFAGSNTASFAGRQLVRDFLENVRRTYPTLSPFRTFAICGGQEEALARRCDGLLAELAERLGLEIGQKPGKPNYVYRPGKIAQEVHISAEGGGQGETWRLRLSLWPGDTTDQARRFFQSVNWPQFTALEEDGWSIIPNLHFSFMSSQLVWASSTWPIERFYQHFKDVGHFGQRRADADALRPLLTEWLSEGLITKNDLTALERHFLETRRTHINIIPGFHIYREWAAQTVIDAERTGELSELLLKSLATPLATWGESLS